MARINKQLQREIALPLEHRIKNEAVKDAIITGVECSRDLEQARVFFTAVDPDRRAALQEELQGVKGALRTLLGQVLTLRHIPDFVPDRSVDYGERIDGILHRLGLDSLPEQGAEGGSEEETDD